MLRIERLSAGYGPIEALRGVSLEVRAGEIVTLIGANGAGKSTLLRAICGTPSFEGSVTGGAVHLHNEDITQAQTSEIVRRGLAHVPEGRRIFPRMTVLENLQLGTEALPSSRIDRDDYYAEIAVGFGPSLRELATCDDLEKVYALFPRLRERASQLGGTLSGGEQQMLALGRALMGRPRLLLLDEPSLGLAPLVIRQIFEALARLNREEGLTIFLVEQNANLALKLANRGYVLAGGMVQLEGSSESLRNDPAVKAAYLEGDHA